MIDTRYAEASVKMPQMMAFLRVQIFTEECRVGMQGPRHSKMERRDPRRTRTPAHEQPCSRPARQRGEVEFAQVGEVVKSKSSESLKSCSASFTCVTLVVLVYGLGRCDDPRCSFLGCMKQSNACSDFGVCLQPGGRGGEAAERCRMKSLTSLSSAPCERDIASHLLTKWLVICGVTLLFWCWAAHSQPLNLEGHSSNPDDNSIPDL
ncbi:uncharacterized protein LOC121477737 [Vulpes lagopus]|uniref:uncharacterized protein LOC121477737 n=1 Tax=Vulpes lagopus TaxID=494514 RepID=UPI001BC9084F|nr:uncharacterized protein LOC121477737 [Vulpes lagopus]